MGATARLLAAIGLNNEQFKNGMASTRSMTGGLQKDFSALKTAIADAFTIGAIVGFINKLKDYAVAAQDAAEATGSGTAAVQALNAAAIDNASSAEKMKAGLEKIRAAQIDALGGNETMRAAFDKLGISMEQIEGVGADRVFELIGTAINGAENQATALAAAGDILGNKLITNLTPALKAVGAEGLDPLTQRMRESGKVMDASMIAKIDLLSDKWENAKTQIMVSVTNIVQWIERLGYALTFALATKSIDNFGIAWDEMAAEQAEANARAVESAKAANAAIVQSERVKVETVSDETQKLEAEKKRAAEAAAKDEIEATRKSAADQQKLYDDMIKARDAYYKVASDYAWDALTPEERLNQLYELRNGLLEAIYMQVANSNEQSAEYYLLQTKLLEVQGEIEKASRESGKTQRDEADRTKNFTSDQVTVLSGLQTLLKDMTDDELAKFISKIQELHKAVGNLDFSGLLGLQALQGFSIPNESVQNAEQFGKALSVMAGAMGDLKLPDLAPLEVLKGFSIPNESVMNARQFGNAIAEMVKALNNTPLDLAPLEKVSDLFTALKGGEIAITIIPPTQDKLMLGIDESFKSNLSSLATSAATIATFKGTIYG